MYRLTVADKETYWIVQRNILPARLPVHVKYDLKGSTIDRSASTKERVSLRGSRREMYGGVAPSFALHLHLRMYVPISLLSVYLMCICTCAQCFRQNFEIGGYGGGAGVQNTISNPASILS